MKKLFILFLTLSLFFISCKNHTAADPTAPSALEVTAMSIDGDSVIFVWIMPTESDFSYVEISYSDTSLTSTGTSVVVSGLSSETEYSFTLLSVDTSGNESDEVSFTLSTRAADSVTTIYENVIDSADDLNNIRNVLNGNYILMADIDLATSAYSGGWTPIGVDGDEFTGKLLGNNHVVRNLTINSSDDCQGLFGYSTGATISHLGLENLSVSGGSYVGGLVGYSNSGDISSCYATGAVKGSFYVGGLVGYNKGNISSCYATGAVKGSSYVGGLVGLNNGTISSCYATGDVDGDYSVGGLVGENYGTILYCYATGDVDGDDYGTGGLVGVSYFADISYCYATGDVDGDTKVGGLFGFNSDGDISYCYATGDVDGDVDVGGLVGFSFGDPSSCYYDSDTTGYTAPPGTGKTTAEMKEVETYSGWDFTYIWDIDSDTTGINNGYPYLQDNEPSE